MFELFTCAVQGKQILSGGCPRQKLPIVDPYIKQCGWQPLELMWLWKDAVMESGSTNLNDEIEIRVPCKAEYVRTVRRTVVDFAQTLDLPASEVAELEIAASEAITNVIKHAYTNGEKPFPVRVKCTRAKNRFTVEVIDKGRGFAMPQDSSIPPVDYDRDGGYGIVLIRALMDRVKYTSTPDVGTRIKMTKKARTAVSKAMRLNKPAALIQ